MGALCRLIGLASLMPLCASAYAQGLDAPIRQEPTVRSEIKRGYEMASPCGNARLRPERLQECYGNILRQYRMSHSSTEAFEIGLGVHEWIMGSRYIEVANGSSGNSLADGYRIFGRAAAGEGENAVRSNVAKLKISLGDAFEAAGIPPSVQPASVYGQ